MVERTNQNDVITFGSMTVKDLRNGFCYGMHGCGFYGGTLKTNSMEAMEYWILGGVNVMEIDVCRTTDCQYVALAHSMIPKYLRRLEIVDYSDENAFTHSWFMQQRICSLTTEKGLTPMDLESIIGMMEKHDNLIVMFDLCGLSDKDDAGDFAQTLSRLVADDKNIYSRILIEAYNQAMIDGINQSVNKNMQIIYCAEDRNPMANHQIINPIDLKSQGINVVSYPWEYLKHDVARLKPFKDEGFVVFSVSKDNRNSRRMRQLGVNVNLVDMRYHWWKFPSEFVKYAFGRMKYHRNLRAL